MMLTRIALIGVALGTLAVHHMLNAQDRSRESGVNSAAKATAAYFSPNLDGYRDVLTIPVAITDERRIAAYSFVIRDEMGRIVRTIRNKETRPETANFGNLWDRFIRVKEGLKLPRTISWDGRNDEGQVVPDGIYSYHVQASDDNNNSSISETRFVVVDTVAPVLTATASETAFSPGGDRQFVTFKIAAGESVSPIDAWHAAILDTKGSRVRNWVWIGNLPSEVVWDGKNDSGLLVDNGVYSFRLETHNRAGNKTAVEIPGVQVLNLATPLSLVIDGPAFSPNGDGIKDTITIGINASNQVPVEHWEARVIDSRKRVVRTLQGSFRVPQSIAVDGKDDKGKVLPEDTYRLSLDILYVNGNKPHNESPDFQLDLTKPVIAVSANYKVFSPNSDGLKDQLTFYQKGSSEVLWEGTILGLNGTGKAAVRSWVWRGVPDETLGWDGRDDKNTIVPDGDYSYQVFAIDQAGNSGWSVPLFFRVDNRQTPISIRSSRSAFSPLADSPEQPKTIDVLLAQALNEGIESWSVRIVAVDDGSEIKAWGGTGMPPGQLSWDGKDSKGAVASDGPYAAQYRLVYEKGDAPSAYSVPFVVDTHKPEVTVTADNLSFSPDGDGIQDSITFVQKTSNEDKWTARISDLNNKVVRSEIWQTNAPSIFSWNGTDDNGNKVPDGEYQYDLSSGDSAGNEGLFSISGIKVATVPPVLGLAVSSSAFSPNGDGSKDTVDFFPKPAGGAEIVSWKLQISLISGGKTRIIAGSGAPPQKLIWDGKTDGGRLASEGTYQATLSLIYSSGQSANAVSPRITLDLTPPFAGISASTTTFSPNNDGYKDATVITQDVNKDETWIGEFRATTNSTVLTGLVVKTYSWVGRPPKTFAWDGSGDNGLALPNGTYTYQLHATDSAGNTGFSATIEITIDNRPTPLALKLDQHWFSPGTASSNSKLTLSPLLGLDEGIESWRLDVRNLAGTTVRVLKGISGPPPTIEWDGKLDSGSIAPDGEYNALFTVIYLKGDRPRVATENFGIRTKAPQIVVSCMILSLS